MLLNGNRVNATTVFLKKEIIDLVNGFDNRFKLLEDYPMWLKLTKAGFKFYFLPKVTVKHRFHINATYSSINNYLHHPSYFYNEPFRRVYIYPNISKTKKYDKKYSFILRKIINKVGLNKNTCYGKKCDRFLTKYFNPFALYNFILKHLL